MIFDAHNDIITSGLTLPEVCERLSVNFMFEKVRGITLALWTTELSVKTPGGVLGLFAPLKPLIEKYNLMCAVEDVSFMSPDDVSLLKFYDVVYASLTWNYRNKFAGGCLSGAGLSVEGLAMVRAMEEAGIFTDTAHLSEQGFEDIAAMTSLPMFCSHACLYNDCRHPRNLKDWQVKEIAQSGGFLGLTLVGDFLNEKGAADSGDVLRHIDAFVQRYGDKNIGIGSDFFGTQNLPSDITSYVSMQILVEKMRGLGYNENSIENILYLNYQNFFGQAANEERHGNKKQLL